MTASEAEAPEREEERPRPTIEVRGSGREWRVYYPDENYLSPCPPGCPACGDTLVKGTWHYKAREPRKLVPAHFVGSREEAEEFAASLMPGANVKTIRTGGTMADGTKSKRGKAPETLAGCLAEMEKHEGDFKAYMKARKVKNTTAESSKEHKAAAKEMERLNENYTAYWRAYTAAIKNHGYSKRKAKGEAAEAAAATAEATGSEPPPAADPPAPKAKRTTAKPKASTSK